MNTKPALDADPPILSVTKVAAITGVTTKTVRVWIATGVLPAYRIGNTIRIRRGDVEAALKPVAAI
jgi:excisionase family DNA binding protein